MYSHCYHHQTHSGNFDLIWNEWSRLATYCAACCSMCSSTVRLWFPTQSSVNVNETMFSHWWTKPIYCIDVANDFAIKSLISWRAEVYVALAGASVVSGRLIINNNHFFACSVDAIVHGEREHWHYRNYAWRRRYIRCN